jgi:predicted amidohydrolase YtcJ
MPRYMVERTFPDGLKIPVNATGAEALRQVVAINSAQGVTWVHSYVSGDKTRTFCIYDAPTPEAIRQVAEKNGLPVNAITEVSVLTPYFYH